jgi:hypothetical protein
MNQDPATLLNLDEDPATARVRSGACWMLSIGILVVAVVVSCCVALRLPRQESDWFGIRYIATIGAGFMIGALFCVAFAVVSFLRRERHSVWAMTLAAPCLAAWLSVGATGLDGFVRKVQSDRHNALAAQYHEQLRRDPDIALREKWYVLVSGADSTRWNVVYNSFSDASVPYTLAHLQRFYDLSPALRQYLFRHPSCTPEFLAAHFPASLNYNDDFNSITVESIISNPNCPIELVEKVAASHLPGGVLATATNVLKHRRPKSP